VGFSFRRNNIIVTPHTYTQTQSLQDRVLHRVLYFTIDAGAGLVILHRQVYLSAEEVDSPVYNIFCHVFLLCHVAKHVKSNIYTNR